ncbi:glycosyltransferase family 2 protein [Streptomyces rapamycinicus]|uniref:Glycosyl transferase family 2 n=2 Tax=Streptomyces rapamycinicus TaxID=1226757 RepID=A0A0A0NJH0_STRRN|nr:glycosyltransferase family 2 protein [Streptomyces rapamycinicus]AGP57336.1 glycosyl transferase family 2 [Streptomyces rapamycinicus NRRL 5491]MBB4784981.1 glycosyltransferase involved in cell wall biosynthesis [Streptomyces rapamycinicus]RLV79542.1 glycosyl transferase family 2 [Streptomyces rapamycinicus NRRL 5491]UTO65218.1 glycosyltransferase family 2 protein [Streptomyces rapamycinicus]UTP33174.1 glycosyltransferase family 2 protein [Streptomyces rapamycinicus NRRL 5491]
MPPHQLPAVSVIMPVLNEERHLRNAVRHILEQEYDGEMEVVIALGPSADRTDEIAAELVAEDPRVHTVPNPTGRTPAALNAAIKASRHPVVVRVDGHGMLSPDYIATAVRLLEETGAQNVGGLMHAEGENDWEKAVAAAMTSKIGVGNAAFHTGGEAAPAETVYLGVFRREALEQQGGYNEEFIRAQDWELNFRIREAGGLIWFSPELKVSYRPRPNVRALAKQYKDYGRWRHVVARFHQGSINLRYLAPPTAVVAIAAGIVLGAAATPWGFVIPGGYLAAIVAGSLPAGRGLPVTARLRIPVALATMHMSWGWGFLTSPRALAKRVIASRRPAVMAQ